MTLLIKERLSDKRFYRLLVSIENAGVSILVSIDWATVKNDGGVLLKTFFETNKTVKHVGWRTDDKMTDIFPLVRNNPYLFPLLAACV